jgi:hypothetical protein
VLELTREDIKSDADLHRVVERLIQIRNKGVLTMADYRMIATLPNIRTKHVNENHVAIAMGNMLDDEGSMVLNQIEELERGCAMIRSYIGKDYEKQLPAWVQSKVTLATDYMSTVGNYLSSKSEKVKEEVEFQEASHDPWKDKHFGPTKIIKQKYHVKTDTKSFNVKADNEDHAHKLVTKHAPGSKIVSIEHKGRMMEETIEEAVMDTLHKIVNDKSAKSVKFASGHTRKVDHFTASALTQVHNALNDDNKKKFADMVHKSPEHFMKASDFAFKRAK